MTATFQQPDYTTQSGTAYPLSIDAAIAVLAESARAFAPHANATPNMTLIVDPGRIYNGATLITKGTQGTGVAAADPTNPRIDRLCLDIRDGSIGVVAGTPSGSPAPPAIPAGNISLCQVYVAAGATAISDADLTDERPLVSLIGGGTISGDLTVTRPETTEVRHLKLLQPSLPNDVSGSIGIFGVADAADQCGFFLYRRPSVGVPFVRIGHHSYDANGLELYRDGTAKVAGKALLTAPDAPAGYTRYSAFYMVNDVPAVNAPALNVDTVLAKNTWVSVGPTGSGATYIWTALDAVPATAKLVELRGLAYLNTLATTVDTATLQARKTGTATSSPWIFRQQVLSDGTTRAYDNTEVGFKVQIDANRRFDLLWDGENFGGAATIILYLVGWYE